MQLVNRYLYAVGSWLPAAQREDVLAEIADDLRSRISDREGELGRPLNEAELAALLKQRGKPELVASRYLPHQALIGPDLLPAYWFLLKLVVLWILLPVFVLIAGPIELSRAANPGLALLRTVWFFLMSAVFATGLLTIVFGAAERYGRRGTENWDPRKLPRVPAGSLAADRKNTPASQAIAELGISFGISLGWLYLVLYQPKIDIGGTLAMAAPVWNQLRVPILLLFLSGIPVAWTSLVWPGKTRVRSWLRLAINTYGVILIGFLLSAGVWAQAMPPGITTWTNFGIRITLLALGTIVLADSAQEAMRLRRNKRFTTIPRLG